MKKLLLVIPAVLGLTLLASSYSFVKAENGTPYDFSMSFNSNGGDVYSNSGSGVVKKNKSAYKVRTNYIKYPSRKVSIWAAASNKKNSGFVNVSGGKYYTVKKGTNQYLYNLAREKYGENTYARLHSGANSTNNIQGAWNPDRK
ncbi:hypothetical protein ACFCVS_01625 [Bacillus altitudinis]|uniref:hypothetical protein n=1 Tax=Bacillus TaxID=1386 RepID=UPI001CC9864B|nr:hypothetical protein [Bacillus sp. RSS_NA_20]MCA0119769.1 hypothetical protein [Bacillus sp. RSS_NA_20]